MLPLMSSRPGLVGPALQGVPQMKPRAPRPGWWPLLCGQNLWDALLYLTAEVSPKGQVSK